ncbi:MAG: methanogen output domain 1-containing protein [Spirochaetales bacterium]|nr:methanogen output domain 1-containing protein [Spirochaetales bacterium]
MEDKEQISVAAVKRNCAWIKGVTEALGNFHDENISRCVMNSAGTECANQILEKTISYYGKQPQSVTELVEAINKRRREVLKADTFWELDGNKAHFILNKCSCDLVEEGLAEPSPIFCLCSAAMFENVFRPFHHGEVRAEIIKAIGRNDKYCEFIVSLK